MKQQTAVEWLINEMPVIDWTDPYWKVKLEKAKAMEKEQITDAYINYFLYEDMPLNDKRALYNRAKQYYNETFNNK